MARPLGEVSAALLVAAAQAPGTVQQLAARARIGRHVARYTASRLLSAGRLVEVDRIPLQSGPGRPSSVLGLPQAAATCSPIALLAGVAWLGGARVHHCE